MVTSRPSKSFTVCFIVLPFLCCLSEQAISLVSIQWGFLVRLQVSLLLPIYAAILLVATTINVVTRARVRAGTGVRPIPAQRHRVLVPLIGFYEGGHGAA